MTAKDYYQILGLSRGATTEEVKAAFRRLALEHHPDRGGNAEKFKEANEAYQVLSDPERREHYDRFGTVAEGVPGSAGFGGQGFNVNFEDLGDIFGGLGDIFGMGGNRAARQARRGGRDIEVDAHLKFEESVFGLDYPFELLKSVKCSVCLGTGGEPGSKLETCPECRGTGRISVTQRTMFGIFQSAASCPACQGDGKRYAKKCSACRGSGAVREKRKIVVKIPAGVSDGNAIKVPYEGEAGERGAPAGDLYVRVRVKPSANFRREGDDLLVEVPVPVADAVLGGTVWVETVDGRVEIKIPPGTQPGTVLKLRGRGVPHLRREGRGDQLVAVAVEVPKKLSKKQRQLYEELKRLES
jgi:molecular chaperone DnaJ